MTLTKAQCVAGLLVAMSLTMTLVAQSPSDAVVATHELTALDVHGGQVVYDGNNHVYWLADANFATSPLGQQILTQVGTMGVNWNANGTMDYGTAQKFVQALNLIPWKKCIGYLCRTDWQLPGSPFEDPSCGSEGPQGASFGGLCLGSALGNLYYVGLKQMIPQDVAPASTVSIGGGLFRNVQPSYYWTDADGGLGGKQVFSFASGDGDATTTLDSFYYVLPMVLPPNSPIDGATPNCPPGSHLVSYQSGHLVYECETGITWLADANLPKKEPSLAGHEKIQEPRPYPVPHPTTFTAPLVTPTGAMLWDTTAAWLADMNGESFLGSNHWQLPRDSQDLRTLYEHLNPSDPNAGFAALKSPASVGPFQHLQPFFYWAQCVPNWQGNGITSPDCAIGNAPPSFSTPPAQMNFDFTFGYGLLSTDAARLRYFVLPYFPAYLTNPVFPCSPLEVTLSVGGWTTLSPTNNVLVPPNAQLECEYSALALTISVTLPQAPGCPSTATAKPLSLAPWMTGADGTPTSVNASLINEQASANTTMCTYQTSSAITFSTWRYVPPGLTCRYGGGYDFACY